MAWDRGVMIVACGLALAMVGCKSARSSADAGADLSVPTCIGRACDISACPAGGDTVLTGRILAPNGKDPVPHARIYVPLLDIAPFPDAVACDLCGDTGDSAAYATSAPDGTFTLNRVPEGLSVPLVVELGRFRRVLTVTVTACTSAALPRDPGTQGQRLPAFDGELSPHDRVPRIAVATGDYDQVECVLGRMGLSQIDLYDDRGAPLGGPTTLPPTIGTFRELLTNPQKLESYNLLVVNCTDAQFETILQEPGVLATLERYVSKGGRIYATDWAYDVIHQVPEFAPYMCFVPDGIGGPASNACSLAPRAPGAAHSRTPYNTVATVERAELGDWLANFPSTITPTGEIPVAYSYVVIDAVGDASHPASVWLKGEVRDDKVLPPIGNGIRPLSVTFDYKECGRVHFSTYNTEPSGAITPDTLENRYPMCGNRTTFYAQERLLEYLLFEISECVPQVK